jgi:outer membrane protein
VLVGFLLGVWWVTPGVWAQAGAGSKIAFVDVQRVLARSAGGAAAREQMERERGTMQKQVDAHRVELEKLKDDLEKKGQLLSPDARKEKQEALERKVRDVRRLVDDLQKELQKKEQELLGRVLRDLDGVIQKVGKERGYLLIVERKQGGIVYGAPEADVTDEIIKMYDDDAQKAKR